MPTVSDKQPDKFDRSLSSKKKKNKSSLEIGAPDRPHGHRDSLLEPHRGTNKTKRRFSLEDIYIPVSFDRRSKPSGDPRMYGAEMCSVAFPFGWELPTAREFRRFHTVTDVPDMMGRRPGIVGCFNGKYNKYPAWKSRFFNLVHVQKAHVLFKCAVLDQAVSEKVRDRLCFDDLDYTVDDYLARIRRLDQAFHCEY